MPGEGTSGGGRVRFRARNLASVGSFDELHAAQRTRLKSDGSGRKKLGVAGGARWPARRRGGRGIREWTRARETRGFAVRGSVPPPRRRRPRPRPRPCPSCPSCLGRPRRRPGAREVAFAKDRTRSFARTRRARGGARSPSELRATCGRTSRVSRARARRCGEARPARANRDGYSFRRCVTLRVLTRAKTRASSRAVSRHSPRARATRGRRARRGGAWRRMITWPI